MLLASLAGLASLMIYAAITGFVREPDEGTAAHLWQLLMAAQLPVGVFFASLFFGFAYALALRLQGAGSVPPQLLTMLPYLATILALVVIYARRRASRRSAHSALEDGPPEVAAAT